MSKTALLRLAISGLLLLACLVNHAIPRLPIPQLRLVPIANLPRHLGGWTCGPDLPIDPKVLTVLPNATFLSRVYRDSRGRTVELFLETSQDAEMFHSPTQCMPAQNWNITQSRQVNIAGATATGTMPAAHIAATEMLLQSGAQNLLMLYWYTSERQLDKWEALKGKALTGRTPTRLFVRILVSDMGNIEMAQQTAQDMAQNLSPAVAELEAQPPSEVSR